jgi:hypothetical protein
VSPLLFGLVLTIGALGLWAVMIGLAAVGWKLGLDAKEIMEERRARQERIARLEDGNAYAETLGLDRHELTPAAQAILDQVLAEANEITAGAAAQ